MAVIEQIVCDGCGKEKQDVNHWWLAWYDGQSIEIEPFRATETDVDPEHLCGAECVIKAVSEYLQKGKG